MEVFLWKSGGSEMPRAHGRPFHLQLRYERQLRGWSQADLAARVGSDPKAQAPIHALLEVACDSQQLGENRGCAMRSLRLLGLSGVAFPVEPFIDALEEANVRAPLLWALSTQGARCQPGFSSATSMNQMSSHTAALWPD